MHYPRWFRFRLSFRDFGYSRDLFRWIRGHLDYFKVSVVGAFSHDLVICDVPEISDRPVWKNLLRHCWQKRKRLRSTDLDDWAPSLGYTSVSMCVCAPLPPICEGIESHKPEAFAQISF